MSHHPNYTMAGLLAIGGTIGYIKAKSVPSLAAGLLFASVYGYSGYLIQQNEALLGHQIATGASVLLGTVMGTRALKSKKPMPVILTLAAIGAGAFNGMKVLEWS
eukprot:Clim_evm79s210 gene=Clim_evmTU79s210